jgi:glutamate synthase domain-containing protein 2
LAFAVDALVGFDLKKDIRVIASAKILTGFHLVRAMALGADMANSARGMMLALGCIQALECNRNNCPTGITTQDPGLVAGLVVADKKQRIANFHQGTVKGVAELLAAAGLDLMSQLDRSLIYRRVSALEVMRLDEIYPPVEAGSLLRGEGDERFRRDLADASPDSFQAVPLHLPGV